MLKRSEIFLANLAPAKGSEQKGVRPVLIVQNDISNKHSPVIIVAAITSKIFEKEYPTNVFITKKDSGLDKDSTILLNQLRTIDNSRLIKRVGVLDNFMMGRVDNALKRTLNNSLFSKILIRKLCCLAYLVYFAKFSKD